MTFWKTLLLWEWKKSIQRMLISVNRRRTTGSRPSNHYHPIDWTTNPTSTPLLDIRSKVPGVFCMIQLNIIIIAVVVITIINLDVSGSWGLHLNYYKSNNGSSLVATIVRLCWVGEYKNLNNFAVSRAITAGLAPILSASHWYDWCGSIHRVIVI